MQRDRAEEKRDRVIAAVVDATEQLCHCGFTAGYIDRTVSGFQCSSKQTSQVVFRSKLYGTADTTASIVTTHINRWISAEVSVVILGLIVAIDPLCPIHISSFSDPECQVATSPLPVATTITPNTMNSTSVPHIRSYTETIIAGVIVGIVILAIAAAVVVIAVLIRRDCFQLLHLPAAAGSLCTTECHHLVETECPRYVLKMCVASYTLSEECS